MNLSEKGLLPCPFCGNADKPSVFRFEGEPYVPGFEVRCDASGWDGQDGKGCGSASGWSETTAEPIALLIALLTALEHGKTEGGGE